MKKKPLKKTSGNRRAISSAESVAKLKQTIAAQAQEILEAAKHQAATSEILRVIASAPTDIQPVLDAVAESAARLCSSVDAQIYHVDGDMMRKVARYGTLPDLIPLGEIRPISRASNSGRAIVDRQVVHIHDMLAEREEDFSEVWSVVQHEQIRTVLAIPLLREGVPIGAIMIRRTEVRPFSDKQINLLKIFADQAVIAIENARLFQDRENRNRDLAALHEVTAAASQSLEIKPVLDEVVKKITEIFHFDTVRIFLFDETHETLNSIASFGLPTAPMAFRRGKGLQGWVAETGEPIIFENIKTDPRYQELSQSRSSQQDYCFFGIFPIKAKVRFAGTISCLGKLPRRLTAEEVQLINSMCDQIGVAVENINLFEEVKKKTTELESSNAALRETLEQQTATGEVLRVIASSPTELQPVLDTLIANAVKLSGATKGHVRQVDGEFYRVVAHYGESPERIGFLRANPLPANPDMPIGRALVERRPIHILDGLLEPEPLASFSRQTGVRTLLATPLLREETPIGGIIIWRDIVEPFTERQIELVKTFADQAVIAIENVRLFKELQERTRELTEALEQQTATGEVLRVIASSPTELQPVLDSLLANAVKLSGATKGHIRQLDGESLQYVGHFNESPDLIEALHQLPQRTRPEGMSARALREKQVVHILDAQEVPTYRAPVARAQARTMLIVPLLREETGIGTITIWRDFVESFTERQIDLVKTFADQAVIAIENVRLFQELTEALEQQTATSEILGVIASSPTDIQPVLDVVAENAARVCGANDAVIRLVEGNMLRSVAHHGSLPQSRPGESEPLDGDWIPARAVLERQTIHIHDIAAVENEFPESTARAKRAGVRTMLTTPLLREGIAIGVIHIRRTEVRPFTDKQVALLKTFADQAVIAIENVRLFNELQQRNRDLTEALEQQTATGEVLRVIASSPTELQPVLDTLLANAVKLSGAKQGHIRQSDGEFLRVVAHCNERPERIALLQSNPLPLRSNIAAAQAFLERKPIHVLDTQVDALSFQVLARQTGVRTLLAVPLLREGTGIGTITIWRDFVEPFTERQIELVKTFADQAVIAIENVRLFQELKESLEQQTATSEILGVIASSPTDIQPVLDIIAQNAARLCGADDTVIRSVDRNGLRPVAHFGSIPMVTQMGELEPIERGGFVGRAIQENRTFHVHDLLAAEEEFPGAKERGVTLGVRTALAVPLVREGEPIGLIHIRRLRVQPFTERQIELVKTFADQAVIAIENVRLFKELQERNRDLSEALEQQTVTSEILRVIASSPTDVQPVLDAIVESAARVCGIDDVLLRLREDNMMVSRAHFGPIPSQRFEISIDEPQVRWMREHGTLHIPDVRAQNDFPMMGVVGGFRTFLAAPLGQQGELVGLLNARRTEVRPFTPAQIKLLETFADQAVIAIENVRLFRELTEALEQQTATSEILGVIASSPTDIQPVLDVVAENAARLCDATDAQIIRVEGEFVRSVASYGSMPARTREERTPINSGIAPLQAIIDRKTIHVHDLAAEVETRFPQSKLNQRRFGTRTLLCAPLLREGVALGAILIRRTEVRPFSGKQIKLLETFATKPSSRSKTSGSSKNWRRGRVSWLDQWRNSGRWERSAKQSAPLLISRPCSVPSCAMRFSSPELIAASSTSTTSRRKSFTFAPAIKWKKSWSKRIRQPRSVSDKGLRAEQRKPGCPTKLPTSARSTNSLPEGCAPFYLGSVINRFWPCRSFSIRKSWEL